MTITLCLLNQKLTLTDCLCWLCCGLLVLGMDLVVDLA